MGHGRVHHTEIARVYAHRGAWKGVVGINLRADGHHGGGVAGAGEVRMHHARERKLILGTWKLRE